MCLILDTLMEATDGPKIDARDGNFKLIFFKDGELWIIRVQKKIK